MSLKSRTFKATTANSKLVGAEKSRLESRHQGAIQKVVSDARSLAADRRSALSGISNPALRASASR